ncbi:hypothetical protein [Anatilimnocola floriformis]|uniref:hypothetical protein n=1 Tax=Anatilimnocola floriformis TaxID=2948575 RepID=UPI0020C2B445|nr:hypothetical protein [Anatilimnocola floriformis]
MTRQWLGITIGLLLCLTVSFAQGQARKGGERPGEGKQGGGRPGAGKPELGRSEPGRAQPGRAEPGRAEPGRAEPGKGGRPEPGKPEGRPEGNSSAGRPGAGKPPGGNWAESKQQPSNPHKAAGADALNNKNTQPSSAEGAAAGAAAAGRNQPPASGAEGAAAGAAAANRNQPQASGAAGAAAGYAAVRNSFDRPDMYSATWHTTHADAWKATNWSAGSAWTPAAWGAVAAHCNYANKPVSYDYGNNVTCLNGNVVIDGVAAGTAEEFSQQASDLAQAGTDAQVSADEKWLPVGVFAMVKNDQQHPQLILQIAVNPKGVVRGNYTDEVSDRSYPIHGGVDPKTQRIAWTVGGNTTNVMEAGLGNLTQGEAPALLHKNSKTERWILVRLSPPQ